MSKFCYLRPDNIIVFKLFPSMNPLELEEAYTEKDQFIKKVTSELKSKVNILTDASEFNWNITEDKIKKIAREMIKHDLNLIQRSAILVNCIEQRMVAQSIITLAKRTDLEIFYNMDETVYWLITGDKKQLIISSPSNKVNGEEEFYYFNKVKETHSLLVKDFHDIEEKQKQLIETERIKSLGQLIGGIAHNLKTPLMTSGAGIEIINKNISKLQNCMDNDKQIPSELINEINYWTHLIENNLIYISDIISAVKGQAQEPNENICCNFSVKQLINRINLLMRFELEKNKCILKIESVLDESQDLKGDINSLIQVFNTLITNAIESCQNEHQITFGILIDDSDIKFYIKNVGKGIPEDIKPKLFNSMITTKGKKGTGMGLYIAQSIIKSKFNGEIYFEDDIDTTFYVKIPMSILLSGELLTVA